LYYLAAEAAAAAVLLTRSSLLHVLPITTPPARKEDPEVNEHKLYSCFKSY
jgi:hypothetical protein